MRRVLLVDDSKVIRDALQAVLEPYGFEVHHAENGATALAQLRASPFDLAFVDINMPVLDGPTLLRLMRAHAVATKVILVTSGASTPVVASAIKLGASDYVAKPFSHQAIRVALARALDLDPAQLEVRPSRLLLLHPDDAVSARLRMSLPAHVEVTAVPVLARLLEAAERGPAEVVLLDARVLEGEARLAAELIRAPLPDAAVFSVAETAPPEARWAPDGPLDGILPAALDAELVRGFLYPNFLRPLVFVDGTVFHAAGFEGGDRYQPAYFASLGRALHRRCSAEAPTSEPVVDLVRVPPFPGRIATLIAELHGRLETRSIAASFRVAPALVEKLAARPELRRAVVSG